MPPSAKAMASGQAPTKLGPERPSTKGEKSAITRKMGRLKVMHHLVTILNIASSSVLFPLLCNSAIVGAKILLSETSGKEIKGFILIAAPYWPICDLGTPKTASKMVSIESSTVSIMVVRKLNDAKLIHSRTSYCSASGVATRETSRKRKYRLKTTLASVLMRKAMATA